MEQLQNLEQTDQSNKSNKGLILVSVLAILLLITAIVVASTPNDQTPPPPATEEQASQAEVQNQEEPARLEERVQINADGFNPSFLGIQSGTVVVFVNNDSVAHSLEGQLLQENNQQSFISSPALDQGSQFTYIYDEPGLWTMYDTSAPQKIRMNVIVTGEQ